MLSLFMIWWSGGVLVHSSGRSWNSRLVSKKTKKRALKMLHNSCTCWLFQDMLQVSPKNMYLYKHQALAQNDNAIGTHSWNWKISIYSMLVDPLRVQINLSHSLKWPLLFGERTKDEVQPRPVLTCMTMCRSASPGGVPCRVVPERSQCWIPDLGLWIFNLILNTGIGTIDEPNLDY